MSAFLLRFKTNYLEKMCGYPHFSLWRSNSPCKDLLFPRGPYLAQKPLYLVGTVLKQGRRRSGGERAWGLKIYHANGPPPSGAVLSMIWNVLAKKTNK